MEKSDQLFGKWNGVFLLVIGFVLTTGLGTWITSRIQNENLRNEHLQSVRESEKNESQKVFENTSDLMDKRIYKMRMVIWAYTSKLDTATIAGRWKDYALSVEEWNEHINKNLALLARYFSYDDREFFELHIHDKLRTSNQQLEFYKETGKPGYLQVSKNILDSVNSTIYKFDLQLLNEMNVKNKKILDE